MSRQKYTQEQVALLCQNPYVYNVTKSRLVLTKEFKEIFIRECSNGEAPRNIFANHGFDLTILKDSDIWRISQHIRDEYKKYGEFHNGSRSISPPLLPPDEPVSEAITEKDEIRHLRHEVEYLKQEVEFLKKISSIRNTRK